MSPSLLSLVTIKLYAANRIRKYPGSAYRDVHLIPPVLSRPLSPPSRRVEYTKAAQLNTRGGRGREKVRGVIINLKVGVSATRITVPIIVI